MAENFYSRFYKVTERIEGAILEQSWIKLTHHNLKIWNFDIKIFEFEQSVQKLCYFCYIKYFLASEYSFAEIIVLP